MNIKFLRPVYKLPLRSRGQGARVVGGTVEGLLAFNPAASHSETTSATGPVTFDLFPRSRRIGSSDA